MTLEVRQLRALVAVIDEGTFTDAAIALHTSQASVSRAVAGLEQTLATRLVLRTSQGCVPTVPGRSVVERARAVLAEVAAIERLADRDPTELRVGFAWGAFGARTTTIQRRWSSEHAPSAVTFVQSGTPTAGLLEGEADIAVLRRQLDDPRFVTSLVGVERRLVVLAADDPLARRRRLQLADLVDRTVVVDRATGTTTADLWPTDAAPTLRDVHGIEEWLTVIASGAGVGLTPEATAALFPRADIRFRPLRDAVPPIPVWLAWWADHPPPGATSFRTLVCELYG